MPSSALMGRARKNSRALLGFRGKRAAVLAVFLGFGAASSSVYALGLGPLEVQSNLGSPLQATAPIQLGSGESAGRLEVAIASESDYQMVGKPRPPLVAGLKVRLVNGDSPSVQLTSARPIEDPLFEVMLRVTSDGNQVLKMYTVTLDPPQVAEPSAESSQKSGAAPPPAVASTRQAGPSPDRPRIQTRELPPQTRETAQPRTSGEAPQLAESGPAVDRPEVEVTEGWSKRDRYGPVRSGDTLATIVQRLRQDSSVPLEAAVVATWKANPEAFIDGNMNLVKKGAVLDIPEEAQVRQYQPAQAKKIIKEQRKEWAKRGRPAGETSPGHERYRLKVSLDDPNSDASPESEPADDKDSGGQDETKGGGAPTGQESNGGPDDGGESTGNEDSSGASEASGNQAADEDSGGKGAEGKGSAGQGDPENAAIVADLRTRITELQQSLKNQRTDSKSTIQAMEKRLSGLQEKLEKQRTLVAQKNAAMERLANQSSEGGGSSGMPGRDRYILYLLAGVNLLMLLAVIALWMRLRSVKAAAGTSGGGNSVDTGATDPLSQANAQAAAGEFKQARSTLWEALAGDPQNWALYGRLLDLYEQEDDGDQFEEVARRLFEQLGQQKPEWQEEIRNRGRQLKPESALFGLSAGSSAAGQGAASGGPALDFEGLDLEGPQSGGESEPGDMGPPETEDTFEGPEEESFDLDFNDEAPMDAAQPAEAPDSGSEGGGEGPVDEGLELDFELGGEEPEPSGPAASTEQASQEDDEEGLEFDLGLSDEGAEQTEETGGGGQEEGLELPGLDGSAGDDDLVLPGGEGESDTGSDGLDMGGGEDAPGEEDLDLDLSLDASDEEAGPAVGESGGDDDLEELDLSEPDSEAGEADLELRAAGPEPAEAQDQEDDLSLSLGDDGEAAGEDDLDMDFSGWDESQEPGSDEADHDAAPQPDEPVPGPAPAEGPAPGGGQDDDEFEIKLDLAQAWIDMGDQESARGLLQEVETRGGPQQKERAQQLLGSMT